MAGRQAIVLIHGIGEQKPMETLRGFAGAVWSDDASVHRRMGRDESRLRAALGLGDDDGMWSKPDRVSESFELRRLTTARNRSGGRTDFFEFYWAHLMGGTTLQHVWGWARTLLLRDPRTVPRQLFGVYLILVLGLLASLVLLVHGSVTAASPETLAGGPGDLPAWLQATGSLALSALILPALSQLLRGVVGDAARYLHPAPGNVQRRHEIREAGIALLDKLHQEDYERIVIVGHSLGSVIGYDILTHAWAARHDRIQPRSDRRPAYAKLDALEAMTRDIEDGVAVSAEDVQRAQREYLGEYRALGAGWRVTDFLTLGSPLAHAEVLLAADRCDLRRRQAERELPTCPPRLEASIRRRRRVRHFSFERPFEMGPDATRRGRRSVRLRIPHHAAVFAATRWTNLYFPSRWVLWGDLIAGPVAPVFGAGVRDLPVSTWQRDGLLSHTLYWSYRPGSTPLHIRVLRDALDLADDRRGTR